MKDTLFSSHLSFNTKGILRTYVKPLVMGIINATPDSFYEASRVNEFDIGIQKAAKMIADGATILDIGGYSSRPGALNITEEVEIERTTELIRQIKAKFPATLISIDTFRSNVANAAVLAGADIINDISGGQIEPAIFDVAARHNCPYIMMHSRGTPQTMMDNTVYENLINSLLLFFSQQIKIAEKAGVKDIIIDPGFGFSKTVEQNFDLLNKLELLTILEKPILIGVSRKSMIYKSLNTTAEKSLNGTTVLNTIGLKNGASIVRVHDVKEAVEMVKLFTLMQ